jgi:predicted nucleotide-binding protein
MTDPAHDDPTAALARRLQRQDIVRGDPALAKQLAAVAEVLEMESGATIIDRDGDDDSLFFILEGEAVVIVDGNTIAHRERHQHVGEMALVDPTAIRSAHVVSHGPSTLARISEAQFTEIADAHPTLWRHLAVDLGSRLRLSNQRARIPNPTPIVFIGPTGAAAEKAEALKDELEGEGLVVRLWGGGGLYGDAHFSLDSFARQVASSDFAVLLLGPPMAPPDSDGLLYDALFDTGVFVGSLGRERTVIVRPNSVAFSLPSDRLGVLTITYGLDADEPESLAAVIRRRLDKLGPK